MSTYEVEIRDGFGEVWAWEPGITATSGEEAFRKVAAYLSPPSDRCTYEVYRHRRLRPRHLEGIFHVGSGGDGGGEGLAGVREPRRPKPSPGHLSAG